MRGGRGHGVVAAPAQHGEREHREGEEHEAGAPVLRGHEHEHADEEDPRGDDLQHDLRVELRDPGDVTVGAFDELAGVVPREPRVIERQHVGGHVGTHAIGDAPREDRAGAAHHDRQHLRDQGDADVGQRDRHEDGERLAGGGAVDEPLQQEWFGEGHELAGQQQDREADPRGRSSRRYDESRRRCGCWPVRMLAVRTWGGTRLRLDPRHESPDSRQPESLRRSSGTLPPNIGRFGRDQPVPSTAVIRGQELTIEVAERVLVDDASFSVYPGDKVGLVGRNGAGKTTLLRTLGGERPPTSGRVTVTGAFGFLPQDPRDRSATGRKTSPWRTCCRPAGSTPSATSSKCSAATWKTTPASARSARFSNAEETFRDAGGYRAESDVYRILAGLGLPADRALLPLTALSGGERRRVELARILFGGTDNLVLDEPTNHLDVDAKEWLMGFLRSYRGALLVVSHDLELLDQAITKVLHLDEGDLREYKGTYTQYLAARGEGRRAPAQARGAPAGGDRAALHARRPDAPLERQARAAGEEPRQARRTPRVGRGHADPRRAQRALPLPAAAAQWTRRAAGRRAHEVVRRPHDLVGPCVRTAAAASACSSSGSTARARPRSCGSSPASSRYDGGESCSATGVSVGYYAQEHEGIEAGTRVIDHLRDGKLATDTERRARARHVRPHR